MTDQRRIMICVQHQSPANKPGKDWDVPTTHLMLTVQVTVKVVPAVVAVASFADDG